VKHKYYYQRMFLWFVPIEKDKKKKEAKLVSIFTLNGQYHRDSNTYR